MHWVPLGKPKGTIEKSKFDKDREIIKKLLKLVGTPTISRSTPTLTKGSYSISNEGTAPISTYTHAKELAP